MERAEGAFPEGLDYTILFDTTTFVSDAIDGVIQTLLEAGLLVFLTIFVFLQDWRGTLIPTITIPVSLIGTFALMSAFGITINLISLFGLVLAIAIVVDDAIVVVENVWRIMEQEGVGPKEAAIRAMEELGGAIAGVTLDLDVGVRAGLVPARHHRPDVPAVRPGPGLGHRAQRHQRADADPGLVRHPAAQAAAGAFFLFRWFNAASAR